MLGAETVPQGMPDELPHCYGYLYEPLLIQCRQECAVRHLCADALKKRFQTEGEVKVKTRQRTILDAYERKLLELNREKNIKRKLSPNYSLLVSEISDMLVSMGFERVNRTLYIAFKISGRVIFTISKITSNEINNLLRCAYNLEKSKLPIDVQKYISDERQGKYWSFEVRSMEELREAVTSYVRSIKD